MNLQDYLLITQAAAFLGVSPNTLRNWGRSGKIATYRHPVNGYRLYKQADLEALLVATAQSGSVPPAGLAGVSEIPDPGTS